MRYSLICLLCLAGCASTDVAKMSDVELCYTAMVDEDNKNKAQAEIQRRKVDCQRHSAEVKKMHEMEQRAGQTGGSMTEGQRPQGGGGVLKGGY